MFDRFISQLGNIYNQFFKQIKKYVIFIYPWPWIFQLLLEYVTDIEPADNCHVGQPETRKIIHPTSAYFAVYAKEKTVQTSCKFKRNISYILYFSGIRNGTESAESLILKPLVKATMKWGYQSRKKVVIVVSEKYWTPTNKRE